MTQPKRARLVASAKKIDLSDKRMMTLLMQRREDWQTLAWGFYDEIAEVKYASLYLGDMLSKVEFYPAYLDADGVERRIDMTAAEGGSQSCPPALAAKVLALWTQFRSPVGGQTELIRLLNLNLEVAGECWIHHQLARPAAGVLGERDYRAAQEESWEVRSVIELEVTNNQGQVEVTWRASDDSSDGVKLSLRSPENPEGSDELIRVWRRHPKRLLKADSHLRGCLVDCVMIGLLTNEAQAISKSRMHAGILTIPSELGLTDSKKDPEPADDGTIEGKAPEREPDFLEMLADSWVSPIENPESGDVVVPSFLVGAAEYLKPEVLRHITFERKSDETIDSRLEKRINRLARGLNVPVEVVMGHMDTTYANASQIDQDKYDEHFEPRVEMLRDSLLYGYLMSELSTVDPITGLTVVPEGADQLRVCADKSKLVRVGASVEENANDLVDRDAISLAAYRRLKGASEADAPTDDEQLRQLVTRKGIFTADLVVALLKQTFGIEVVLPPKGTIATGASAITASGKVPLGKRLAQIDRDLRTRLLGAAEMAMDRVLERAGNKATNKLPRAQRNNSVPAAARCAHYGAEALAAVGLSADDLLDDAWAGLEDAFRAWVRSAGEAALDVVSEALGGFSAGEREALRLRMLNDEGEAWAWLSNAMSKEAKRLLFAPGGPSLELGELDVAARVPPGMIREALALAGGVTGYAKGLTTNGKPVGGVATGETMLGRLADGGLTVNAFVWSYGAARRRSFDPHRELDGTVFDNFDDGVLANTSGFPDTAFYYPGDHDGCLCDADPVIIERDRAGAVGSVPARVSDTEED